VSGLQPALEGGIAQGEPTAARRAGHTHRSKAQSPGPLPEGIAQIALTGTVVRRLGQGCWIGHRCVEFRIPLLCLPVATPSSSRFLPLLRWMGITLVVLLVLQLLAVLNLWDWNGEAFRQLLVDRLISQSPMALVGLLLMLLSSRLEDPAGSRTPIRWVVTIISGVLALMLIASLPVSISGDQILQQQSDQQLNAKKSQLETARQQSKNPMLLKQLVKQAEAAGQLPEGVPEAQKIQFAQSFIERQLDQMEAQVKQTEQTSQITIGQRRYVNSGGSVVLIVAFTLLSLAAIL
jgi:hypothetical protein